MADGHAGLSLRERQKAQTRAHLLAVATTLIATKGFNATSIEDIAKAAGSSRATVYSYFDSKDAILTKLIRNMWEDADAMYREFGALSDWSRPSVHAWVESVIARHEADAERNRAALEVSFVDVVQHQEDGHRRHIDSLTLNADLWGARFSPEEARGRASVIIAMIEGYTTRWFLHRVKPERGPATELLTDVITDVLHAPGAADPDVRP